MLPNAILPPLPVALPMLAAAILLIFAHALPRRAPDWAALAVAVVAGALCALMAARAAGGPLVYWFGGWTPHDGVTLGIAFVVDQASAGVAVLACTIVAASFLFSWGYFDEVHAHFHVLMLLFLAGMVGFCLTHDLFNLFVWFEIMSVAAFALTAYQLEAAAVEGALDFTVINALAGFLMLGGIGLIYARAGALDFTAIAHAVAVSGGDPVVSGAFCLLATALLIKAATVPFQFWLADAHAVAPSPVSVVFSGAMVSLGVFGLAKISWEVFAADAAVMAVLHSLVLDLGAITAIVGALMCIVQRHLKRLLAFSTISHVGIMLIGLALVSPGGTAGMLAYLAGHGLVKGALFMVAGILLAGPGGIDEIGLRGKGREVWPAGIALGLGGLLLAGLPLGAMAAGSDLITEAARQGGAWAGYTLPIAAVLTGGAVLRATGRIFLGLGQVPGEEDRSPTEEEHEKADRPLWLMMLPCVALLALAVLPGRIAHRFVGHAVPMLTGPAHLPTQTGMVLPWITTALAILVAGFDLGRGHLPRMLVAVNDAATTPVLDALRALHSGIVGDYVAWLVAGIALFALAFALV